MYSIVFFDGVCNLCNGFVDFLIRRDQRGVLRYAPLQGSTARKMLAKDQSEALASMAFVDVSGRSYVESSAALHAIASLGGIYSAVQLLLIVPSPLRNLVYRFIAANRYRIFGKSETCRLPTPQERDRFLD